MAKELEGAREQADADTKMVLRQVEKDSDELVALLKKERQRQREQSCWLQVTVDFPSEFCQHTRKTFSKTLSNSASSLYRRGRSVRGRWRV